MVFNKKAISPVVATALLLVVAVVAVVGFQSWYQSFQSEKLVDVSNQAGAAASFSIQALTETGGNVYIRYTGSSTLNVTGIVIDGNACDMSAGDYVLLAGGTTGNISTSTCTITSGTAHTVLVITNSGTVTETVVAID